MESNFYYQVTLNMGTQQAIVNAPWVVSLPSPQQVTDQVAVLPVASGSQDQGMYLFDGSQWRFVLPYTFVCEGIVFGAPLELYFDVSVPVTVPSTTKLWRNGTLWTSGSIIEPGLGLVWAAYPITASNSTITSVNDQTPDGFGNVEINIANIPGLEAAVTPVIATTVQLGQVIVGNNLTITAEGVLSANAASYTLPVATAVVLGGVKQGANIEIASDGTISGVNSYTLPVSTSSVLGGVKIGANVSVAGDGTISVGAPYELVEATTSTLGGVVIGQNIQVNDGVISVDDPYTLPEATSTVLGGVTIGANISVLNGEISVGAPYSLPIATSSVLGGVKQGFGTTIASDGTISVSANVLSFNGRTGAVTLTTGDITTALGYTAANQSLVAPISSPTFTGIPSGPTAANGTNTTQLATTAFVEAALSGVTGGLTYEGVWNAATNTPTLTSGVGTLGEFYKVSVAGTTDLDGNSDWSVNDVALFNGGQWQHISGTTSDVTSVAGRVGTVVLTTSDIGGLATVASTGSYTDLSNKPTIPTVPSNVSAFTNDANYATQSYVNTQIADIPAGVTSFNSRTGAVTLTSTDISNAGGALLAGPTFTGVPSAPTASTGTSSTQLATTAFVHAVVAASASGVTSFNSRTGAVVLTASDVNTALTYTAANAATTAPLASPAFTGTPTAPTATTGVNTTQLATTAFVNASISAFSSNAVTSFNSRTGAVTLTSSDIASALGYTAANAATTAPLASPTFTGVPAVPTATTGTSTTQAASTAFVQAAISSGVVTSFNTRTGAVSLVSGDVITALGYTPLPTTSPGILGVPTAPTATTGTNTTQLATTAFVQAQVSASAVTSFNTRSGTVTLSSADITGAGGALLASPALTGVPTAPTATSGTNTTQVATTAFVTAAVSGAGVTSFNSRTGAVTLTSSDVTTALTYTPASLSSPSFTGRVQSPAYSYSVVNLGATSGTQTLNLGLASEWVISVTGTTTFAFTNTLGASTGQVAFLRIGNGGSQTINWPSGTQFAGGTAPALTASGNDVLGIMWDTVGGYYMVFVIGLNMET